MIKQTTLHNILTWVIAVILFIFQSLNYLIAWIKKYVKNGEKTTTVVTADTTISSESNPSNKNAQENVITVQELIQKHFDIPLIIAEDEPKVYNFIKSAKLLTSNEICKEKNKIDKFMENLVDDSYVARGLGLITATVGRQSEFYLYSKYDNNFENIVIKLNGRNGEVGEITILNQNPANIVKTKEIPINYFYDKDRIKVTYTPFAEGVYTLTLVRNSLSICRSPYYISVEKIPTNSRSQIRLGTKKYKPVTKFTKSKHLSLETSDNSIPVIELSKPSICKNILPVSEENSIRTDVMSIVTKFESNSISAQKKVHKHATSIPEKGSETDLIDDISTYSNIKPKIETDNVYYNNVSDLNSHNAQSKSKSTDNNFWNDVDITYRNRKASDINAIDSESERIKKSMTNFNKNIRIAKDIPWVKNVSPTHVKPTSSVLEESLHDGNSLDVEKRHQTFKTPECIDENTHIETLLDLKTRIDEYEIKCIDNEPFIQNELSCFDDDDRKTEVVMKNINEIESNPNDIVIQQVTDSAQYNINTPFASIITKISNSVCKKCSIQVLKIISEFSRDINITHDNNSKEMRSSFETLLAQPISININIDNMFEHPISAANEQNSEHLLNNSPIKNNSDELCGDINNPSTELMIKTNKLNSEISKTIKDKIIDHCTVPLTENAIDTDKTVDQKNELSTNEILEIKFLKKNEENEFTNDNIHESNYEMEIQGRHLQKSSEHNMDLIKTNQFHENINREFKNISKESDRPLYTSELVTIDNEQINEEPVRDEFKINYVNIVDKNTSMESSVINNTVLPSMEVILETSKYNLEHNEEQNSTQNENQKLMIEKSIEPVLTSFKNKMVEKITQLYLNKDLSNTDNTTIVETHDKHLTNNLKENQIHNIANNTEINTKCIETLAAQLKNHIDKNEISEIILDEKKTNNNHLFKYVENIIKTNINSSDMYAQTLGEKKLQTLVNTAMNHPNNQQIGIEFKKMILDNETQDVKLKKINNGKIVQDIEASLAETQSVPIIKNTDELTSSKNEVTVKTECKLPLINDFISIERNNTNTDIKQQMQTTNENGNVTMIEINAEEIKELPNFQKSHNTAIITPIIELQPMLETQIMNTSEPGTVGTVGEHSLKAIQTTIEIIESNIPKGTDEIENIDDKKENQSVKLQIKENENVTIEIPHLIEKKTVDEILENTSTNITTKSNFTEKMSMQQTKKQEIETLKLKKILYANDENIEREIIYTPSPLNIAENIFIDKPNPQITPVHNEHVSNNEAIIIGIKTSEPQFSNTTITELIPSKIPMIENNSINPKQKILNTLNKLDAIERLTIPKYSTTCDTKKAVIKYAQNVSESTLSPKELNIMKNMVLEKTENTDETCTLNDTEIETLEFLNRCEKMKSIPLFTNDTSIKTTMESKTEKNTLQKTFNSKYNLTTMESTANEIIRNNNENETFTQISSMTEELEENPIKIHTEIECTPLVDAPNKPDLKVDEMLLRTKEETPCFIVTPTASSLRKTVVEFVTKINKKPIETLAIILHENIEENIVTVREIPITMNNLTVVMEEQINIKTHGSDTNYAKVDDKVKTTEIKTRISIDQKNAENIIKKEPEVRQQINSINGIVIQKTKEDKSRENKKPLSTSSMEEMKDKNKIIVTLPIKSTIEYLGVSKEMEDTNEIEKKSYTYSSTVAVEESPTAINSSDEVVEENTKDNFDKENEKLLSIDTSYGPMKENNEINEHIETILNLGSTVESTIEESVKYIAVTAVTCTDSDNVILDIQTDIDTVIVEESLESINFIGEKNIDQEPPIPTVNSLDEVIAENSNENLETEKDTLLPIKISSCLMEEQNVIEGITEIILPIESTVESTDVPKEIKAETETEITKCTKSSTEIIGDQIHADRIVIQESPVESNSSSEVVGKNTTVNIDTEIKTPLLIKTVIESIEELKIKENRTSPPPIKSPVEVAEEKKRVNIDIENTTPLPIESVLESTTEPIVEEDIIENEISCADSSIVIVDAKIDVGERHDEGTVIPINSSDKEVSEKNYMNSGTEKETLLSNKTSSDLVEERKLIEKTTDIIFLTESSIEHVDEPKVVEDIIIGTERTSCTETSTEIIADQKHIDRIDGKEPLLESNSSNEIITENTIVNIDTENKTQLFIEPIAESEVEEDKNEKKIVSYTASSTADIEAQMNKEKYVEKKSLDPINTSNEVVRENSNMNIEVIDEQNHTDRIVDQDPLVESNSSDKVVEDTNENIDTEKETLLSIDTSYGPVKENNDINEHIETLLNLGSTVESIIEESVVTGVTFTDSDNVILDIQTDIDTVIVEESLESINFIGEKNIDQEPPVPTVNSSDEVIAENTNEKIDTEKDTLLPIEISSCLMEEQNVIEGITEIILPIESTMESTDEAKEVKSETETEITKCTKFSMEMNGDQIHTGRIVIQEFPVEFNSSNTVLEENTKDNIDKENEKLFSIDSSYGPVKKNNDIDELVKTVLSMESTVKSKIEEPVKYIAVTAVTCTDSTNVILDVQTDIDTVIVEESLESINSIVEKNIDQEPPVPTVNSSDEIIAENTNENIDTEKETLVPIKISSCLMEEQNIIERITEIILPIESNTESTYEPKDVKAITETEITSCIESSTKIIGDQIYAEKKFAQEYSVTNNSSDQLLRKNMKVNIHTEKETHLLIESVIESLTEPGVEGDKTEIEIPCTVSSTSTLDARIKNDKYSEEESPELSNSSDEVVEKNYVIIDDENEKFIQINTSTSSREENKKIDKLIETLLPVESTVESIEESVEDTTSLSVTSSSNSSNISIDVQTAVEKVIREESSPQIICENEKIIEQERLIENNSQDQSIAENTNGNIHTEKKTSPIKLSSCLMEEQNVIEGITEIILPVESAMESTEERKIVDDIIATEITSSNEFSTKIIDDQINSEKVVDREHLVPNNFSDELLGKTKKVNIQTKNGVRSKIEPVIEFITEPGVKEDKTKIEISCSNSSTVTADVQTKNDKYNEEETTAPINSSDEVAGGKKNVNNDIENATPLPIESFIESIAETILVEDIIETKISCANSSIVIVDAKIDVDEGMNEGTVVPINSSDDVLGEKINFNIDTDTKTPLFIEPIAEREVEEHRNEKEILSVTVSSTSSIDAINKENYIEEEPAELLNSSDDVVEKTKNANIDNEREQLLPVDTSSGFEEKNKKVDEIIETLLPVESTVTSIKETVADIAITAVTSYIDYSNIIIDVQTDIEKVIGKESSSQIICVSEDSIEQKPLVTNNSQDQLIAENKNGNIHTETETETEITSSTKSLTKMIDDQINAEKIVKQEHLVTNNSSDELLGENKKVDIHTKNETLLNIEPIVESIAEPSVEEDKTEIKISCSNSSTATVDAQTKNEHKIEEESPAPIVHTSDEESGEKNNINIDIENTTPLPIESVIESITEPIMVENITETEISCADSCIVIVDAKIVVDERHDRDNVLPFNYSDEEVSEKIYMNSDTEKETLLSNKTSSDLVEERKLIERTTDIILPTESSIESIDEPKVVKDIIIGTERTSCTETSTEIIGDQKHIDRIDGKEPLLESNSSNEIITENTIVNIDTENKTQLFIEPIAESEVEEDKNEKKIVSYTASSTADIEAQMNKEKYVEKKSLDPINTSNEVVRENSNMNIEVIDEQNHTDRIVDQDPLVKSNSSDKVVEDTNENIDTEKETLLSIGTSYGPVKENNEINEHIETILNLGSTVESIIEESVVTGVTFTDSANVILDIQTDIDTVIVEESLESINFIGEKNIDQEPPIPTVNSLDEVIAENSNENLDTEKDTLLPIKISSCLMEEQNVIEGITEIILPIESTVESTDVPKEIKAETETEITKCTKSSTEIIGDQIHADRIVIQESPVESNSLSEVVEKNTTMIIDTENKTSLPIESRGEPIMVENITETEISCSDSSIVIVDAKIDVEEGHDGETVVAITSSDEEVSEKNYMNTDTEKETLLRSKTSSDLVEERKVIEGTTDIILPIESSIESIDEPKVFEDVIVETEITSCTETSMEIIDHQYHTNKNIDQEPLLSNNSSVEVVGQNKNIPVGTIVESLEVSREVEYIYETEKTLSTNFSSVTVDVQIDEEKEKESQTPINFLTKILGGNTRVNFDTENETLLLIESNEESVLEPRVEKNTITAVTSCIDSSNVAVDVQIDTENVIGEEYSVPINSLCEVVEEHTNVNIDAENDTALQIDISTSALKAVIDEKVIKNEYSISSFLVAEKQSNIDSKTKTLSPIETFVDEPNVVGYKSVNEHGAHTDSSTTRLKKQIKIDSETEIETLSLINNLTESVKEQIVEKITENKTPTLIDSSSEIFGQGNKVDIDIDNQTPLPMNTSSTTIDGQIVKNIIENETPIYCLVDVPKEQTKVNIENNIETFMPIDILTASVKEQLSVEYLSENERTAQIERESGNEISTPVNYSTSITIEQTDVQNLAEKTLPNDDVLCRNPKTNLIGREIKTDNSDNSNNSNNSCLQFEKTSKIHSLENEDNLQRKSYGIQKLEMSVQHMKTSDEDYYEKTFLQLEQTEKISKVDNVNIDGENKTIIDEKLYTVNESDLNAILCASSLEEALTLLDSKIKFKFKHKKSSKINSKENIPKIQTFGQSSGVNTNFTDAREFFKEIEKKSKK